MSGVTRQAGALRQRNGTARRFLFSNSVVNEVCRLDNSLTSTARVISTQRDATGASTGDGNERFNFLRHTPKLREMLRQTWPQRLVGRYRLLGLT